MHIYIYIYIYILVEFSSVHKKHALIIRSTTTACHNFYSSTLNRV